MLVYKRVDWYLQILLILGMVLFVCFAEQNRFFHAYFIVGGWQLLSCLIHALFMKQYVQSKERVQYLRIVLWIAVIVAASIALALLHVVYFILVCGYGLLLISPLLAFWYIIICYKEIQLLFHKSLVHFK